MADRRRSLAASRRVPWGAREGVPMEGDVGQLVCDVLGDGPAFRSLSAIGMAAAGTGRACQGAGGGTCWAAGSGGWCGWACSACCGQATGPGCMAVGRWGWSCR